MSIFFPENYSFVFTRIFGNTSRVKIIEFFLYTLEISNNPAWTYISQISRLLGLSKSSIKKVIDDLLNEGLIIEKKIETHAQNPQRNLRINKDNEIVSSLLNFYKELKNS